MRPAAVSHHIFLRTERDENGAVKAFYGDVLNEHGHYINWQDNHSRLDTREFQVGEYTVSVF